MSKLHTFEHTVEVAAPVEQVFEWSIEPENWERSTPSLSEFVVHEETDEGVRLAATYSVPGMDQETEMEMEVVEPNRLVVTSFESSGMTGEIQYRFEEIDGGTKVVQSCEYEFGDSLLERIIEPVASRYNKRQFWNSRQTSKELIEAEVAADREATIEA
jgi:carbon monoxide dehydrogenase subunit G